MLNSAGGFAQISGLKYHWGLLNIMEWMKNPSQDPSELISHNPGRVFQGKDHFWVCPVLFPCTQCEQRPPDWSELWLRKAVLWKIPLNSSMHPSEPNHPGKHGLCPFSLHSARYEKAESQADGGRDLWGKPRAWEAKKETEITELNLVSSTSDKHPGFWLPEETRLSNWISLLWPLTWLFLKTKFHSTENKTVKKDKKV